MLCSRCKKRAAVIFMSLGGDANSAQGLCMPCAQEVGAGPIKDIISKMGVSEQEFEDMQEKISEAMKEVPELEEQPEEMIENEGFSSGGPMIKDLFSNILFPDRNADSFGETNRNDKKFDKSQKRVKRKNLDLYCTNLTAKAKNGELDRVIGRDKEINRAIQILCRRSKNNPCLIGEPGVGKTAIAEGLAIRINDGNVPFRLQGKEIQLLDLTALVAGTQFRGQFESRIKGLVDEVKKSGNVILFIDEVHNLVGTGDSEGSMSAANILKPALSRGEIQVIGATTFDEYRKHIEKDSALERRFQSIKVEEPSIDQTVEILCGVKDYYETHHRVKISDRLIKSLVVLSERYITDRFLPDKAIDLMDEACTCAALGNKSLAEYDKLSEKVKSLQSEKEKVLASGEQTDYEKLAEIKCEIAKYEEKIEKLKPEALGAVVTHDDIAKVIELWTGIPSSKIEEQEFSKLEFLEDELKKRVIGQDEAVHQVAAAIRRNRVQISPRRRPASFIFAGSTGVGKTELVKVLANELFDSPDALIRLDMSEYMEKHSASKIVGSPPGYVGYDEAGQLTEKVRQKPYSVVLLDEIEKAHPDVMNILLQILDEGKITDSHGRQVNFENTVIVMTSNAGSDKRGDALGFGTTQKSFSKAKTMKALREFLKPEFLSRLDEIIVFNELTEKDFVKIAAIMLDEYKQSLGEHNIGFSYDEKALEFLAKKSIGGKSGARDLRNLIRKEVEDKISLLIVKKGSFNIGNISLTADEDGLEIEVENSEK